MIGKRRWHTLEQRRIDSRLVLFYKIVYGYVAIPLPSYVIPPTRLLSDKYLQGPIAINTHFTLLQLFSGIVSQHANIAALTLIEVSLMHVIYRPLSGRRGYVHFSYF